MTNPTDAVTAPPAAPAPPPPATAPSPPTTALADAARTALRRLVGREDADFRDGQLEAVSALVADRSRVLVVQRTGWGKSSVYFRPRLAPRIATVGGGSQTPGYV